MYQRKSKQNLNLRQQQQQQQHQNEYWFAAVILFFMLVIIGVVLIIVLLSYPYPHADYYRDSTLVPGENHGRSRCSVGEEYDASIDICAPTLKPFLPELVDNSVKACDSFFNYVSGKWISTHQNENRAFTYIHRKNQKYIHDIIRDPKSGPVYDLYRSCLDTVVYKKHKLLDKQQYNHVYEHIMGALKTHADLPIVFARLASYGFTAPLLVSIEPHPTLPRMVPLIRMDFPFNLTLADAVTEPLLLCLQKLARWNTEQGFEGTFVEYLKSAHYVRDMTTMSALLDASLVNFWKLYFRELNGYAMEKEIDEDPQEQPVWLLDKHYITQLVHNLQEITIEEWKAYVEFSIEYHNKQFVPQLPDDTYFKIHNPVHRKKMRFRHKMLRSNEADDHVCMTITHKLMPGVIGNIYLNKYMPHYVTTKERVTRIVESVRDAFVLMIRNCTWLSEATRELVVVEKLQQIIVRVVHPNYYEEETFAPRMTRDTYLRNLNIIRRYFATRNFELWTKGKPNRDLIQRFGSPITTVNAFYSPITNTITIFGGILHEPIYSVGYDEADLYPTIGMIAAHELAHAIDNTGRLFDKEGSFNLVDPWTSEEVAEFNRRTARLMREYEAPFGCVNEHYGEQTIGEDLADLNGLKAAFLAYKMRGYTDYRRFFQIFGQMWAESFDLEKTCDRVKEDVHPTAIFRVDKTLRQMSEFKQVFNCHQKDAMVNSNPVQIY